MNHPENKRRERVEGSNGRRVEGMDWYSHLHGN
jgi:hypothetical protein